MPSALPFMQAQTARQQEKMRGRAQSRLPVGRGRMGSGSQQQSVMVLQGAIAESSARPTSVVTICHTTAALLPQPNPKLQLKTRGKKTGLTMLIKRIQTAVGPKTRPKRTRSGAPWHAATLPKPPVCVLPLRTLPCRTSSSKWGFAWSLQTAARSDASASGC